MRTLGSLLAVLVFSGYVAAMAQDNKVETAPKTAAVSMASVTIDGYGLAVRPLKEITKDGDKWESPLPIVQKNGRYYMAAPLGRDFGVDMIMPKGAARVEFVVTIDGVSIVDGTDGSSESRGYIVTPAEREGENVMPGWRRGDDKVARFVFTKGADSYAALTDRKNNVGVIGVKIYAEFLPEVRGGTRGGTAKGLGEGHDTGTGYGREAEHRVSTTTFDRGRLIGEFQIEYASREALERVGIVIPPLPTGSPLGTVNAFPADKDKAPTVPPPPGWKP